MRAAGIALEIPARMRELPIDDRGFVVPYFVGWKHGKPDHRIADDYKLRNCIQFRLCWLCGNPLGPNGAFCIGPMCAVNRVTSEPPSHRGCAEWAVQACPFLSRPHARRRPIDDPEVEPPAGMGIERNPGVSLIWITDVWHLIDGQTLDGFGRPGLLFALGDPRAVSWWRAGRTATRNEVEESIDSGLPILLEVARDQDREEQSDGAAVRALLAAKERAMILLPEA